MRNWFNRHQRTEEHQRRDLREEMPPKAPAGEKRLWPSESRSWGEGGKAGPAGGGRLPVGAGSPGGHNELVLVMPKQ